MNLSRYELNSAGEQHIQDELSIYREAEEMLLKMRNLLDAYHIKHKSELEGTHSKPIKQLDHTLDELDLALTNVELPKIEHLEQDMADSLIENRVYRQAAE